jgi:hypothetical protein
MKYFLVVFNRGERHLISVDEFEDADTAMRARFTREARLPGGDVEVVVLGAESRDALANTHSRYFGDPLGRELTEVG